MVGAISAAPQITFHEAQPSPSANLQHLRPAALLVAHYGVYVGPHCLTPASDGVAMTNDLTVPFSLGLPFYATLPPCQSQRGLPQRRLGHSLSAIQVTVSLCWASSTRSSQAYCYLLGPAKRPARKLGPVRDFLWYFQLLSAAFMADLALHWPRLSGLFSNSFG